MPLIPLFTWSAIHAVFAALSLAATVLGGLFWYLMRRIDSTEDSVDDVEGDVSGLATKVETLWAFAFGREDDATDKGLAGEVEEGFEAVRNDVNRLEKKVDTYHEQETQEVRQIVDELHDEDEIDFKREDVYEDD